MACIADLVIELVSLSWSSLSGPACIADLIIVVVPDGSGGFAVAQATAPDKHPCATISLESSMRGLLCISLSHNIPGLVT